MLLLGCRGAARLSSRSVADNALTSCTCAAEYFEQFGKVSKVRVSRSKRTGKSRGYAFLQFQHAEVAAIAAEAMDGYMMFGQTLRCHTVAPADVHAATFRHANRKMRRKPWLEIAAERHNAERTPQQERAREAKLLRKDARRKRRLAEVGIDYEYEPLQRSRQAVKTTF